MREKIAEQCHEQWSGWMKYLFSKCVEESQKGSQTDWMEEKSGSLIIPIEWVERWTRQMNLPYSELREDEKDSDRREADKFIAIGLTKDAELALSLMDQIDKIDKEAKNRHEYLSNVGDIVCKWRDRG